MKFWFRLFLLLVLIAGGVAAPAFSGDTDPLFVNLTTDEPVRANAAVSLGKHQLHRGHPLTIFLHDKGVLIGIKANSDKYADAQKTLGEAIGKGAVVLVCPACMNRYGVKDSDLLPGLKVANAMIVSDALFKEKTQPLSW